MRNYASEASAPKAAGGAVCRRRSCGGPRLPRPPFVSSERMASSFDSRARSESPLWGLATADVTGVARDLLNDAPLLAERLAASLVAAVGPIAWHHHRFSPGGVSSVGIARSARVVMHTWPERDALTVDLYAPARDVEGVLAACVGELLR